MTNLDSHLAAQLNDYLAATATDYAEREALQQLCDVVDARDAERTLAEREMAPAAHLGDLPVVECVGSSMLARQAEASGVERHMEEAARIMAHVLGVRCAVAYGTTWLVIYREVEGRHSEPVIEETGHDIGRMARSAEDRADVRLRRAQKALRVGS